MGKMETLLTAIDPLLRSEFSTSGGLYTFRTSIRYDMIQDTIRVSFSPTLNGRGVILLFSDLRKDHRVYYYLIPVQSYKLNAVFQGLRKNTERVIFSLQNIFEYLQLGNLYDTQSEEFPVELHAICLKIKESIPSINEAFSEKTIETTYKALSIMEGNDEKDINCLLNEILLN